MSVLRGTRSTIPYYEATPKAEGSYLCYDKNDNQKTANIEACIINPILLGPGALQCESFDY